MKVPRRVEQAPNECRTVRAAEGSLTRVSTALIALSLIPVFAGAARVSQLARGTVENPENARFVASPLPIVLHVFGATLFCVLGALQFAPKLRQRRWHRVAG